MGTTGSKGSTSDRLDEQSVPQFDQAVDGTITKAELSRSMLLRMEDDEDIKAEREGKSGGQGIEDSAVSFDGPIPLNWHPGGHQPNAATRVMLDEAGGIPGLQRFTRIFYEKAFQDPTLSPFIRDQTDPHGTRFAVWIAEKFGDSSQPWSAERATRLTCPFQAHGHTFETPHDRSSAHFAAWHSPKREVDRFGDHFKLDDCRVWMRLHFWALRESGLAETSPNFFEYYVKFIAHFVSVYEKTAPVFARESARWSASQANIAAYMQNNRVMEEEVYRDRHRSRLADAVIALPPEEQDSNVGKAGLGWPYVS